LLQKGDKKLYEVAKAVGYDSDASFSKAFKRVFGVAPREYRQNATGHLEGHPRLFVAPSFPVTQVESSASPANRK